MAWVELRDAHFARARMRAGFFGARPHNAVNFLESINFGVTM